MSGRITANAALHAANVATATRNSKRRRSSSNTKIVPASGALNAVARPAPAPAANSTRASPAQVEHTPTQIADRGPHLNRRPFAAERHARPECQHAADEFDRRHGGAHRDNVAADNLLHALHAAT